MKPALRWIPTEVWVDVFRYPCKNRKQLGEIVDKIGNHRFAEYLQFYLHDWGKHKLNHLRIEQDGLYKYVDFPADWLYYIGYPLAPMPDNIKSFKHISIRHFDAKTINFLRQIGPILSDVNLDLRIAPNKLEDFRVILANLLPLLNGTRSLAFEVQTLTLSTVKQCLGNQWDKLEQLAISFHFEDYYMNDERRQTTVNSIMHWMTFSSEHDGNGPKLCQANFFNDSEPLKLHQQLFSALREHFLVATNPSTLILWLFNNWPLSFAEFHLHNNIGEELHGERHGDYGFQIVRHQANRGKELEEWSANNRAKCDQSKIVFLDPTIGLLDAMDAAKDAEEQDYDKPTTSKKARIA